MEQYKQEFIEFMIDCNVLKIWRFYYEIRKKDTIFCKYRILPYRCAASQAGTVLCKSDRKQIRTGF